MILRKILQLNEPAGEAPGPVRAVELEHPSASAVGAGRVLHCLILFDGRFGKLLTEQERLRDIAVRFANQRRHSLFAECVGLHAVVRQPGLHLRHGVGVVEFGQFPHRGSKAVPCFCVMVNALFYERHIHADAAVVDLLVKMVFIPHRIRSGELRQLRLYLHFGLHITEVVGLVSVPLFRVMLRQVSCPSAVCLRGSARRGEITYQIPSLCQLLLLKPQYSADPFQGQRQTHIRRPHHRAAPRLRVQETGAFRGKRMTVVKRIKADAEV